jgi:hypothetical protein
MRLKHLAFFLRGRLKALANQVETLCNFFNLKVGTLIVVQIGRSPNLYTCFSTSKYNLVWAVELLSNFASLVPTSEVTEYMDN